MLYAQYMVTCCGILEHGKRKTYYCELKNSSGHDIEFHLTIAGCVGEKEYKVQYDAIASLIKPGDLLHCEFAWQCQGNLFRLCISGIIKATPINMETGEIISSEEYLNPNRGFWARMETKGEWMRFPGLIPCSGNIYLHLSSELSLSKLSSNPFIADKGYMVWIPKPKFGKIKNFLGKFFPIFYRMKERASL